MSAADYSATRGIDPRLRVHPTPLIPFHAGVSRATTCDLHQSFAPLSALISFDGCVSFSFEFLTCQGGAAALSDGEYSHLERVALIYSYVPAWL